MGETFLAIQRSDKRDKNPTSLRYRFLTHAECRGLHGRVLAQDDNGHVAAVTITSVKTWKTRPEVEVHWKFGLYEFGIKRVDPEGQDFFVTQVEESYACPCGRQFTRWEYSDREGRGYQYGNAESNDILGCDCGRQLPESR